MALVSHLKAEGFDVSEVTPDGRIHRFKLDPKDRKSGWYVAFRNFSMRTGEEFFVMVHGSWRGEEPCTYCSLLGAMSREDKTAINRQIQECKKRAEEERIKVQEEAAIEVEEIWNSLQECGTSEYLNRKFDSEIQHGARFDQGTICIPVRDVDGRIWSLQKITPNGDKWFHPGGRVRGCFHTFGSIGRSGSVYIAEGFSTAGSIYRATEQAVACAFNAGNLCEVAANIRRKYPDKTIIIAGDDDVWKEGNVGRQKAELAARQILGKSVFPKFKNTDSKPTDWNDLHCLEGLDTVKEQLSEVKAATNYLTPLGFKEKEYFFTSSSNQQIVPISAFSKVDLLNLMPLDHWEACYPGKRGVDWDSAITDLMTQARIRGIFQSQNIRGAGVWEDSGRVVVNMGDHLIVDGIRMGLGEIKSSYFYTLGIKLPGLNERPLNAKECETITEACRLFKWKKPDFGFLLAGAMVTTRVCGALPIRPHLWLTGEKGSGKTTLFNRLIYPLIGEPLIFAGGNTTEAGIRQEVSANAVPVLFDEFENNGQKSAEIIQSILDLMRLSWSETKASVIKGSAGGTATSYRARFAAIVTSIRQVSMTDADRSRFATVELAPHENDMEHWAELESVLDKIDLEFGSRLFARSIRLLPVLLENFKTMKQALGRKAPGQRFGDQYGMLLAGYAILLQDEPMDMAQADMLAGEVKLEEEREESGIADQENALNQLLTTRTIVETSTSRRQELIGRLISQIWTGPSDDFKFEKDALLNIGIRVDKAYIAVICPNHAELEKTVYRGTRWSNSWGKSLCRLPGAVRKKTRIGTNSEWAIRIFPPTIIKPDQTDM